MAFTKNITIPNTTIMLNDAYHRITDLRVTIIPKLIHEDGTEIPKSAQIRVDLGILENSESSTLIASKYIYLDLVRGFGGLLDNISYANIYSVLKTLPAYEGAVDC